METSLHRELKSHYAESEAAVEVRLGPYRIDAISDGELIEIQFASLSAIRQKITDLVRSEQVRVVKPIVARRRIIRQQTPDGPVTSRRLSPKRGATLDLFDELVYLTRVFPNPNLVIEVPLVSVEEWRLPPAPSRRWRRYKPKHQVKDVVLSEILSTACFSSTADLLRLAQTDQLPSPFDTAELAEQLDCSRTVAQRIAYVLRQIGGIEQAGRRGNAILYAVAKGARFRKSRSPKRRASASGQPKPAALQLDASKSARSKRGRGQAA